MLTVAHELPLQLIDNRPELALNLARDCGLQLADEVAAEVISSDLTRITPVIECRADRAVLLRNHEGKVEGVVGPSQDPRRAAAAPASTLASLSSSRVWSNTSLRPPPCERGAADRPRYPPRALKQALVVEVQRSTDTEARTRWPGKVATAYQRYGCDAYPLVICPDGKVATWSDAPVVIGAPDGDGMVLRQVVIPPDGIPRITDPARARAEPELAVLSVLGHGGDPDHGELVTRTVAAALLAEPAPEPAASDKQRKNYVHYLLSLYDLAPQVVKERLEEYLMYPQLDMTKSEVWMSFPPFVEAQLRAKLTGEAQGRSEGLAEGKAEGRAIGEVVGEAKAILLVLRRRGIWLEPAQERHILDCVDQSRLENWLLRAVTAESAADVLDDELETSDR